MKLALVPDPSKAKPGGHTEGRACHSAVTKCLRSSGSLQTDPSPLEPSQLAHLDLFDRRKYSIICKALRLLGECGKAASCCLVALLSSNTH